MNKRSFFLILILILFLFSMNFSRSDTSVLKRDFKFKLDKILASKFANMALNCIEKEYPNKPSHVLNSRSDILSPDEQHPAFYGCFDWHSAVHGHWMLVKILKEFPGIIENRRIRAALNKNLTKEKLEKEVYYFNQKNRKSFERTYGWAWLLKLADELNNWNDPDGKRWSGNLKPLEKKIVNNFIDFLPKQTYPIRTGVHPNTAFGLVFAYDYAKKTDNKILLNLIVKRSVEYFENDVNCPDDWEPGGEDFLSPCLEEADLMIRVLGEKKFKTWFKRFLPDFIHSALLIPAIVSDRSDGKLSHLDGLNLSRAWCLADIMKIYKENTSFVLSLKDSIKKHAVKTLSNIRSGHYAGEHWLGSFAVYMFSRF